jgi:hypothetical protein
MHTLLDNLKINGNNTNQWSCVHEDVKISLIRGNICYNSVENLMFSHLLSKDEEMSIPLLHTFLDFYGYKIWCIGFKEEYRLKPIPDRASAAPRLLESRV